MKKSMEEDPFNDEVMNILKKHPEATAKMKATGDVNDIYKWNIPELQIPPNGFEIIYCSGDNIVHRGSGTVWQTLIDQGSNWKYALSVDFCRQH